MDIAKFPEFDDHEAVVCVSDKKSGLRGFIFATIPRGLPRGYPRENISENTLSLSKGYL